jgi:tyrosinase
MLRLAALAFLAVQLMLCGFVYADAVLDLWTKGLPSLEAQLAKSTTCTKSNLQVRKEW